ncbi:MAG: hypothetical protein WCO30_01280 [bacterium]
MLGLEIPAGCRHDGTMFELWWFGLFGITNDNLSISSREEATAVYQLYVNKKYISLRDLLLDAKRMQPTFWDPNHPYEESPAGIFFKHVKNNLLKIKRGPAYRKDVENGLRLHMILGSDADVISKVDFFFELVYPETFVTGDLSLKDKKERNIPCNAEINLTLGDVTSFGDEVKAELVAKLLFERYLVCHDLKQKNKKQTSADKIRQPSSKN